MSRCSANSRCISIAYGSQMCILYSTDPRSHFDESAISRSDTSNLKTMLINEGMKSTCYVNNLKASTASEIDQCAVSGKRVDSICSEWSEWDYVFDSPCGERANFTKYRSRERNCTQPLFGGFDCVGNRYEKYEKGPHLFDDPIFGYVHLSGYDLAKLACESVGMHLFTGLHWVFDEKWEWGNGLFWTARHSLLGITR
ncbi:uncharacterized protein LOC142340332 [Convolutriloba macropyga]|uniref:uncharacterized protein LOC142340332 n=1 Tax=Convolutriloba macropyga TaxID=536237 RepID=UPI003F51C9D0